MKACKVCVACVVSAAIGAVGVMALAVQPEKKPGAGEPPAMPPEMAAWLEMGKTGPEHEMLRKFAGTWHGTVEMFGPMAGPPSKGTMTNTLVLGGRFLRHEWKGDFMGQAFEGLGYWGYDRSKKKWVSSWMDTMLTGMMVSEGEHDAGKKAWTSEGKMSAPDGTEQVTREVLTWIDDDHHTMEMFDKHDGEFVPSMKITYVRAK